VTIGVVHIFIHICGAFLHGLWATSDQGKRISGPAKIMGENGRSRGVLPTPARLLTPLIPAREGGGCL
jgi:hypothetical protein